MRARRRPQPKATGSVADMLRATRPPQERRATQSEGPPPLTQWRVRPRRRRHPSPHCRRRGSTAGQARKRPSPIRHVPPGRRAGTSGGPVGGTRVPELDSAHPSAPLPLYIGQRTLIDECHIHVFFTRVWYSVHGGGGSPKALVHNLLIYQSLGRTPPRKIPK